MHTYILIHKYIHEYILPYPWHLYFTFFLFLFLLFPILYTIPYPYPQNNFFASSYFFPTHSIFSRNIISLHILTKPLTLTPIFLILPRCPTWSTRRVLCAFFRSVLHPTMPFSTLVHSLISPYIMFHSPTAKHHYHRTSMLSCLPFHHNSLPFLVRPSLFHHFPVHHYLFPVSPPLDIRLWIWYTCVIFGYLSEPMHSTQVRTHIRLSASMSLLATTSNKCQVTTYGCWCTFGEFILYFIVLLHFYFSHICFIHFISPTMSVFCVHSFSTLLLSAFRCLWFISTFIRDIVSYRHFSGMYIGLASLTAVVEYPGCLHDDVLFTSQVNGGYTQRSRQLHSLSFGHKWFICCHFLLFNWIDCPVITTRCVPFRFTSLFIA